MRDYRDYKFSFEKLEVYKRAIEFTNEIFNITLKFKKEIQYSLGDQFRRAALSICNNLAEGSDKQTKDSKVQFYGYALDSARECIPMINLAKMQGQITDTIYEDLRSNCIHICNMLSNLIRSVK
jgi:four helix bundle protein